MREKESEIKILVFRVRSHAGPIVGYCELGCSLLARCLLRAADRQAARAAKATGCILLCTYTLEFSRGNGVIEPRSSPSKKIPGAPCSALLSYINTSRL